jgi:hypothetical protein
MGEGRVMLRKDDGVADGASAGGEKPPLLEIREQEKGWSITSKCPSP